MARLFLMTMLLTPLLLHGERVAKNKKLKSAGFLALGGNKTEANVEAHTEESANSTADMYWYLFGPRGPKMSDVKQGALGDCWYLATLASIARSHPNVIRNVFVRMGTSKMHRQVWLLRFLIDGQETMVALDEQVPVAKRKMMRVDGSFFFANTNDGNDVWPILLEKGLAKIFGSYLATRGGRGQEAFKTITQAPVDEYKAPHPAGQDTHVWEDPDKVWNILVDAVQNRFPISGGTSPNNYGVVSGHEFAIIGVGNDPEFGRTVEVFNPWSANRYSGKMMKKTFQFKGDYSLPLDEFLQAFDSFAVARIRDGYTIHSTFVPVGEPVALKIRVRGNDPFTVQLEWPTKRYFGVYGCAPPANDRVRLMVSRVGTPGPGKIADMLQKSSHQNLYVDMQGAGEYLVYVFASFGGVSWAEKVVVNAYANEEIAFERVANPIDVGRQILGFPCRDLTEPSIISGLWSFFDSTYRAMDEPVGGSPAWLLEGSPKVLWVNEMGLFTTSPSLEKLTRYFSKFDPSGLKCAEENLPVQAPSDQQKQQPESASSSADACGWQVGEAVSYHFEDKKWICAAVESTSTDSLILRYMRTGRKDLGCNSPKLKKVTQCKYQEDDELRYFDYQGGKWVDVKVAEVGCGTITFNNGVTQKCDSGMIRYPEHCPFHRNEKVLVWSHSKARWIFGKVKSVHKITVTVIYRNDEGVDWTKQMECSAVTHIRKLSRCEKISHAQLARVRKLNNFEDLLKGYADEYFMPQVESIGPAGADCGDSATGGDPEPCGKMNHWGAISDVLH